MQPKICCIIGHGPQRLPWGKDETDPRCIRFKELLREQIEKIVRAFGTAHFITGMSRGVDTYAAAIILQIKKVLPVTLECALACEEQAKNWTEAERDRFFDIVSGSDRETMVQRHYSRDCYDKRNRHMVKRSRIILIGWDGRPGRMEQTLRYARQLDRPIIVIDPLNNTVSPSLLPGIWQARYQKAANERHTAATLFLQRNSCYDGDADKKMPTRTH